MPFFIEIARFALKGLIVVAIFFLATLAVIAAFAVGGGAGGGDGLNQPGGANVGVMLNDQTTTTSKVRTGRVVGITHRATLDVVACLDVVDEEDLKSDARGERASTTVMSTMHPTARLDARGSKSTSRSTRPLSSDKIRTAARGSAGLNRYDTYPNTAAH